MAEFVDQIPQQPGLAFEEKTHQYILNGTQVLPSVTTLMKPLSDTLYAGIRPETLQAAAERGTEVHSAIEDYVTLGITDISEARRGYFEAFLRWMKDYNVQPISVEHRAYHPALGYAGTLDMLCTLSKGDTDPQVLMWDHLREVLDDPHALVIANPPTYFSGYEKFYDTQGKMTWKEPPYQMFDPATGHQQLYDLCMNSKALVVCYQEKRTGEAVGHTIFARAGTRADLNSYITTNREEEAVALAHGKKIKRPSESKLEPLECSMLPRDYEIREDSKIRVIQIKAAEAQYYRELWTHNFVGSSATWNRAVLIDGYIAAVFGISKMAADSLFVWYVMKVPHKTYRLGRLCYMLAQNREFCDTLLDELDREKVTKIRTAMITKYPENKEVRGIMKLCSRAVDKQQGYKLTYLVRGKLHRVPAADGQAKPPVVHVRNRTRRHDSAEALLLQRAVFRSARSRAVLERVAAGSAEAHGRERAQAGSGVERKAQQGI